MKKYFSLLLLVLAFSTPTTVHAFQLSQESCHAQLSDTEQVRQTTQAWIKAVNSHKAEDVAALYEDDAVLLPTLSPKVANTPELRREYFNHFTAKPNLKGTITEEHIRVYGDTAVNSGLYTFTFTKNGHTVAVPARFSFVYERTQDGWIIVDHHSSKLPLE